jgi:hypothetical protein
MLSQSCAPMDFAADFALVAKIATALRATRGVVVALELIWESECDSFRILQKIQTRPSVSLPYHKMMTRTRTRSRQNRTCYAKDFAGLPWTMFSQIHDMDFYFPESAQRGLLKLPLRCSVAIAMTKSYESAAWPSNPNGGVIYAQSTIESVGPSTLPCFSRLRKRTREHQDTWKVVACQYWDGKCD